MVDWPQIVRLPNRELARIDLAILNLACAAGLPGLKPLDLGGCLRTLDTWAGQTYQFTERAMPRFWSGRCDYPFSEPRFRIQAMITYLQRNLGLRYRLDKRSDEAPLEPADSFLNGIFEGKGGTCGSLPVLYVAVGRRLGYPLKLATTRCHLYLRWEGALGGECFNIEASGDGVSFLPDEYYRTGRYAMPAPTIQLCGYLESLSPVEELAGFLVQRGECWMEEKRYNEAVLSFAWATELDPRRSQHLFLTCQAIDKGTEYFRSLMPPCHFPVLDIGIPPWQFTHLPREVERRMIALRITEGLLQDPELEERWWGRLRRNPYDRPKGLPKRLHSNFRWNFPPRQAAPSSTARVFGRVPVSWVKSRRVPKWQPSFFRLFRATRAVLLTTERRQGMTFSPNLGRWLEEDPAGYEAGDNNLYRYVGNRPVNTTDPYGLAELDYDVVQKPTPLKHGAFETKIRWKVKGSDKGGVIIQQVDFVWEVKGVGNREVNIGQYFLQSAVAGTFLEGNYPYQEAWVVNPGATETTISQRERAKGNNNPHDDFVSSPAFDIPKLPCTGKLTITLQAKFYEGGKIPADFKILNKPPTGELPAKLRLNPKKDKLPEGGLTWLRESMY